MSVAAQVPLDPVSQVQQIRHSLQRIIYYDKIQTWSVGRRVLAEAQRLMGAQVCMGCSEYVWTLIFMGSRLDLGGLEGYGMGSVRETHLKKQGTDPDWMRSKRYLQMVAGRASPGRSLMVVVSVGSLIRCKHCIWNSGQICSQGEDMA